MFVIVMFFYYHKSLFYVLKNNFYISFLLFISFKIYLNFKMKINFPQDKISKNTKNYDHNNKMTKRDFMNMILNDQIKVTHKLQD